ncbi:DUF4240 domain-containing protein [Actinoplanes sp. L3-i22]|uniref:DUF4240 domain-containing protein n=1 Tax=Actinoplanes sp. L3-i22 TaxID=2836373 RepID=UPI001C77E2C2|nr:DUF4240 domain-containing protein [Actinoplanes sp. L3-i22]BCY12547.1 hypothetical protein L3i22_076350 [Actinoplanes sp. L3-i22]
MDMDGFWRLIEDSGREGPGDRDGRLAGALRGLDPADIEDFEVRLQELRDRVDTNLMWGAAYLICGGLCSGDGFWYFQPWLVGQGRAAFEAAAADPDTLAGLPAIQRLGGRTTRHWTDDEWPEWESLAYVASPVYHERTGVKELRDLLRERGRPLRFDPGPVDPEWDFDDAAEMRRRFPRLSELFPPGRHR